ncbi:DNA replication factor Cdt1 [Pararge aegeria]|uniref:Jg2767 protein n=2 Tax=Pararge aegeria TaxID=116150 RepID=A0A8S4QQS0_9NEOP|nr:DNA replication factor Cdt1 [Pararge aegeria]CAH2217183.1 jg2767 [Pararge aegeria aegeria]
MSQTTLTAFFNSRKRPATDEIVHSKNKIAHIERTDSSLKSARRIQLPKHCDIFTHNVNQTASVTSEQLETTKTSSVQSSRNDDTSIPIKNVEAFAKKANASNIVKNVEPSKPVSVNAARKELSLGDIRKKLAASSRLAEIKAAADRLSKGIQQQLKETRVKKNLHEATKKNLQEFKSIDVDVPQSPSKQLSVRNELLSPKKETNSGVALQRPFISPRKVVVSPIKSPSKVPAYLRHSSLASSSSSLPLPHHYRFLAELFRGMETVVALLYNRNEKISFNKLKPSVQEMLKRNFTDKHLAQIKHLVPDFYNFEVQKNKNFSNTSHKESFELMISPNFPNDIKIMNPSVLLERRRYFYDTLLQLVKKHHAQFCSTLDPPIEIPDSKLVRWHPEFELEKIPDIESAKLPELPHSEKYSSAQDVLAKARELFKCNTKMERALEKLAQAKARGLTEQEKIATGIKEPPKSASVTTQTCQPSTSNIQILNPALRNLPAALLEKVKAKQAAKALEAMTRSSDHEQKYLTYTRLPDLARTLRNIFVTERKNVLALNVVLSKLDSSFKSNVSASDLNKDIKLLAEEAPDWIKLHEVRNTTYLKLDKNADLKKITSKLEATANKYSI